MACRYSFEKELNQVLFEGSSCVKKVILNRPQRLNILGHQMVSDMTKQIKAYDSDCEVKVLILKGNGKAFCAGGDILATYFTMLAGHWSYGATFYKNQLTLHALIARFRTPVVALIDGIVMGGGAGLSMNAMFKIVTERTVFAMPEAAIGFFTDVGSSYFLSRLPGYFGEYLGLTGARLNGPEMVACGLATHFVLSKDLHLLESELDELTTSDTSRISEIISKFARRPTMKQEGAYSRLEIVNRCFSGKTVEEILSFLEDQVEARPEKWIVKAVESIKSACPTSLKVSLKLIREGRMQVLEECLSRDYTVCCHFIRATVSNDFYEGVKAKFIDKDKKPKWNPSKLELVSKEIVDVYFSRVDEDDWEFLQLTPPSTSADDYLRPRL